MSQYNQSRSHFKSSLFCLCQRNCLLRSLERLRRNKRLSILPIVWLLMGLALFFIKEAKLNIWIYLKLKCTGDEINLLMMYVSRDKSISHISNSSHFIGRATAVNEVIYNLKILNLLQSDPCLFHIISVPNLRSCLIVCIEKTIFELR